MASDLRLAAGDESFALDVVKSLVVIEQCHIGVAAATAQTIVTMLIVVGIPGCIDYQCRCTVEGVGSNRRRRNGYETALGTAFVLCFLPASLWLALTGMVMPSPQLADVT
jgi:hypothetical protein